MFALHKGYLSTGKFRPFHQPIFPHNRVQLHSGMSTSYRIIASVVLYSSVVLRPAEVERESAQDSYMPEPLSCLPWRARSKAS